VGIYIALCAVVVLVYGLVRQPWFTLLMAAVYAAFVWLLKPVKKPDD
jgi:EamA domain-containing membrane protein RarD